MKRRGRGIMFRSKRSSRKSPLWRRIVLAGIFVLVAVGFFLFGRGIFAWCARTMATRQIDIGAFSTARDWLAWSAWLDPDDSQTDLMRAACLRRLHEEERLWNEALQSAKRKGAPAKRIEQEIKLARIQSGEFPEGPENKMGALIDSGLSPSAVATAFVLGHLAQNEPNGAHVVLKAWEADHPGDAHVAYMRGVYQLWLSDHTSDIVPRRAHLNRARAELTSALARQPRHEPARMDLAGLLEDQHQLGDALEHYSELADRFPANRTAKMGLARMLQQLGHLDEARAALHSLASLPEPPPDAAAQIALIEFELGNYEEAKRWFDEADLDPTDDSQTLTAAATTAALMGKPARAERLFAQIDAASIRSARIEDLLALLSTGSQNRAISDELKRLAQPKEGALGTASESEPAPESAEEDRPDRAAMSARELYALDCAACHGTDGSGKGRAAKHLFPKPRDLRTGEYRLVSTKNGVPAVEDLEAVIRRGMPGTSMRAFDDSPEAQRMLLAEEVQRLNREGIRNQFVELLRSEEEEFDEEEVRQIVALGTTAGEPIAVPKIGPADTEAIARGKDRYFQLGCHHCHGKEGSGLSESPLFDSKGRLSPPRNLIDEPLKGGAEPESIYLRIFAGMPGTPHPSCSNLPEEQLIDLVHYCRSLSREPKRASTNYERALQAASWKRFLREFDD